MYEQSLFVLHCSEQWGYGKKAKQNRNRNIFKLKVVCEGSEKQDLHFLTPCAENIVQNIYREKIKLPVLSVESSLPP
jgi:hypothetical protein